MALGGKALESIEGVFKAIDKDGSGDLDHREFKMAMDRLGLGLTEQQIVQTNHTPRMASVGLPFTIALD